jgi:hypothetical protein
MAQIHAQRVDSTCRPASYASEAVQSPLKDLVIFGIQCPLVITAEEAVGPDSVDGDLPLKQDSAAHNRKVLFVPNVVLG